MANDARPLSGHLSAGANTASGAVHNAAGPVDTPAAATARLERLLGSLMPAARDALHHHAERRVDGALVFDAPHDPLLTDLFERAGARRVGRPPRWTLSVPGGEGTRPLDEQRITVWLPVLIDRLEVHRAAGLSGPR